MIQSDITLVQFLYSGVEQRGVTMDLSEVVFFLEDDLSCVV